MNSVSGSSGDQLSIFWLLSLHCTIVECTCKKLLSDIMDFVIKSPSKCFFLTIEQKMEINWFQCDQKIVGFFILDKQRNHGHLYAVHAVNWPDFRWGRANSVGRETETGQICHWSLPQERTTDNRPCCVHFFVSKLHESQFYSLGFLVLFSVKFSRLRWITHNWQIFVPIHIL